MQANGEKPNIFDVSFKIYVTQEKGAPNYILGIKGIAPLKKEDRAAFGALFLDFAAQRAQGNVLDNEQAEAADASAAVNAVAASVTEAPAEVVIPTGPLTGTATKPEVITI
jgi:hypothetical protein